jgi:hypothetical protein
MKPTALPEPLKDWKQWEEMPSTMASNYQEIAATPLTASPDATEARGLWARALDHMQTAVCGLHGHDPMLQFERGRMFLRCSSCGYQTPGWDTGDRRPRPRFSGDAARHLIRQRSVVRSESVS